MQSSNQIEESRYGVSQHLHGTTVSAPEVRAPEVIISSSHEIYSYYTTSIKSQPSLNMKDKVSLFQRRIEMYRV